MKSWSRTLALARIGAYTTSGATVNPALISDLNEPTGIAIVPTAAAVPEPSSLTLLGLALPGLGFRAGAMSEAEGQDRQTGSGR